MNRIKDWAYQWLQVIILIFSLFVPTIFDFTNVIRLILEDKALDFDTAQYYLLANLGNWAIGVVIMLFVVLMFFRKHNSESMLNIGKEYHNHSYLGYLFCAKILGYKKCCLVRVPVPMQFKLIIYDTFKEYDYGEDADYKIIDDEKITVKKPDGNYTDTVNLVLSDTYAINKELLPNSTKKLSTIWIMRDNKGNTIRAFSNKFYEEVRNSVGKLPANVCKINLYATLNPKHCWWIARNVFKQANRSNIQELVVFPQPNKNGKWNFAEKGISIF